MLPLLGGRPADAGKPAVQYSVVILVAPTELGVPLLFSPLLLAAHWESSWFLRRHLNEQFYLPGTPSGRGPPDCERAIPDVGEKREGLWGLGKDSLPLSSLVIEDILCSHGMCPQLHFEKIYARFQGDSFQGVKNWIQADCVPGKGWGGGWGLQQATRGPEFTSVYEQIRRVGGAIINAASNYWVLTVYRHLSRSILLMDMCAVLSRR